MKLSIYITLFLLNVIYPFTGCAQTSYYAQSPAQKRYSTNELIKFMNKPLPDSLRLVSQGLKYGMINRKGEVVIPLLYDEISVDFQHLENLLYLEVYKEENELFYFFWEEGYESEELYEELKRKQLANPMSILNLETKFQQAPFFVARKGDLSGVVNTQGEEVVPFEYSKLVGIGRDLLSATKSGKTTIIDPNNTEVIPECDSVFIPFFRFCLPFGSEFGAYVVLIKDGKYGALNTFSGEFILPKYDSLEHCNCLPESHLTCAFDSKDLCLNCTKAQSSRSHLYGNVIRYKFGNKLGLIDVVHMKEITLASFDYLQLYGRRSAQFVKLDNEYTILIGEERSLYKERFDSIGFLKNNFNVFKVFRGEKAGVMNSSGEYLLPIKWADVTEIFRISEKNCFIVKCKGKYGVVEEKGHSLIRFKYDSISLQYDREQYRHFLNLERNGVNEELNLSEIKA